MRNYFNAILIKRIPHRITPFRITKYDYLTQVCQEMLGKTKRMQEQLPPKLLLFFDMTKHGFKKGMKTLMNETINERINQRTQYKLY